MSRACGVSAGIVEIPGDCNDGDDSIYPGAEELCDDIDQDCDEDLVGPLKDSDVDGLPDCIDAPYIPDVAPVVLEGVPGTQAGESLHIDAAGRLSIGAPMPMDGEAYVYVMDTLETGLLDGDAALSASPGWDPGVTASLSGFGQQIASMPLYLVGPWIWWWLPRMTLWSLPSANQRRPDPSNGHRVPKSCGRWRRSRRAPLRCLRHGSGERKFQPVSQCITLSWLGRDLPRVGLCLCVQPRYVVGVRSIVRQHWYGDCGGVHRVWDRCS